MIEKSSRAKVRELKARVLGAGDLNIQSLSSVELSDVMSWMEAFP
jgi:hypothetical protein